MNIVTILVLILTGIIVEGIFSPRVRITSENDVLLWYNFFGTDRAWIRLFSY